MPSENFEAIELPTNPPDVGVFHICRFNVDWLPIVLGAVQEALNFNGAWRIGEDVIDGIPLELDQLLDIIAIEVEMIVATPTYSMDVWAFQPIVGAWQRGTGSGYNNGKWLWNASNSVGDIVTRICVLPAGNYRITTMQTSYSNGGNGLIKIGTSPLDATLIHTVNCYSASGVANVITTSTFTLSEDFNGYLIIETQNNPSGGGGANSITIQECVISPE